MSRAGANFKGSGEPIVMSAEGIPLQPQVVQKVAAEMKLRQQAMIFGNCRNAAWAGKFPLFRSPEAHGAMIADNVLMQIQQQMMARQAKLVVPKAQVITP